MNGIDRRYGQKTAIHTPINETVDTILSHKTCRAYLPDPVAEDVLALLVAAAQSAPSSCNLQCWSVVAISDPDRLAHMAALCGNQRHVATAPLLLCFLADLSRLEHLAARHDLPTETLDYLETMLVGVIDATLAAQNFATAAESLGLGTSYIGGLRNDIAAVRETLRLPARIMPVFGMTVGHPVPACQSAVKPRLAQDAVLHRDVFQEPDHQTQVTDYNTVMARFNEGQGRSVDPWSLLSAKRIATIDRMEGRDRLRDLLHESGLALK